MGILGWGRGREFRGGSERMKGSFRDWIVGCSLSGFLFSSLSEHLNVSYGVEKSDFILKLPCASF